MFPDFDYGSRLDRARELMADFDADVLLLSVGADLPYFTGYEAMPLERLTMLVVPRDAGSTLVVPRLEAARVVERGDAFSLRSWDETEDPVAIVAGLAGSAARAAVGDATWSVFLLGLQEALPRTTFQPAGLLTRELRMRKEPEEIDLLREAAAAADRVLGRLGEVRFVGRTEQEVGAEVAALVVEEGHDQVTFSIVASGPNAASPHHETGGRSIGPGDSVVLDFGGRHRGYHSDVSRTLHVGEPSVQFAEAYAVLEQAQAAGRAAVSPGVAAEEVDRVTRQVIEDAGYGEQFIHRTGHGIGLDAHEHPYIVEGNELPLEVGMTFSVEPGIYQAGQFGMRLEDIVTVVPDGVDELNRADRGLYLVE